MHCAICKHRCSILVYYTKSTFPPAEIGVAILQSGHLDMSASRCLTFKYQISSPAITLNVLVSRIHEDEFRFSAVFRFADQITVDGWNTASIALLDVTDQFRLVAEKAAVTSDVQFVSLDDIVVLQECQNGAFDSDCALTMRGHSLCFIDC